MTQRNQCPPFWLDLRSQLTSARRHVTVREKRVIIDYTGSIRRPFPARSLHAFLRRMQKRFELPIGSRYPPDPMKCADREKKLPSLFRLATDSKHRSILRASGNDSSATKTRISLNAAYRRLIEQIPQSLSSYYCYLCLVCASKLDLRPKAEDTSREFYFGIGDCNERTFCAGASCCI